MPLQLEDKMINLFRKVIPGQVLPEEMKEELREIDADEENKNDFAIVQKGGLLNQIKNSRVLISNLILTLDMVFDLVEKIRKLIYWED